MCQDCAKRKFTPEQMAKMWLASKCGLAFGGIDDEGEINFIGTENEWRKFNKKLADLG